MPVEKLRPSFTFDRDRLEQLKAIVPEAFADGKINWETLREALGEHLEDEGSDAEHFGLTWPGKRAARRRASEPSRGTLVPVPGEGVDEETTRNIFIEADNLEALKLMLKAYAGRVKMIYIDPPYNTGNDFIYHDDFREKAEDYLRRTGQMSEQGQPLTTNTKADGRFHSNWLNMIYPRILLAQQILSDDGVIWVSIDDGEIMNLRLICNEIFGEENFVATFIWEKRTTRENRRVFSFNHDYVLCYAKSKEVFQSSRKLLPLTEETLSRYTNPDNDPRGEWQSVSLNAQAGHATADQFYTIVTPAGRRLDPPPGRCWSVTPKRYQELLNENRLWFGEDGNNAPRIKMFLSEINRGLTPHTLWKATEVGTTDTAKKALNALFSDQAIFDTPKPVDFIRRMAAISTSGNDIVMDFFAGSGTTAQAMMELNTEDSGNRQFILVQLAEPTERSDYPNIAEITKERIRRAGIKIKADRDKQLPLDTAPDLGFRSFRFVPSIFKQWQDYEGADVEALERQFAAFETPLVDDWKEADLLTEVMLLQGYPLDSRIETPEGFTANTIRRVSSDFHAHSLYVCLDPKIAEETIAALALGTEDILVCLDSALTDESKMRLADVCNLRVI